MLVTYRYSPLHYFSIEFHCYSCFSGRCPIFFTFIFILHLKRCSKVLQSCYYCLDLDSLYCYILLHCYIVTKYVLPEICSLFMPNMIAIDQ